QTTKPSKYGVIKKKKNGRIFKHNMPKQFEKIRETTKEFEKINPTNVNIPKPIELTQEQDL
ncbi:hypothetical protein B6D52_03260, partial [Candidatus Parcubacteria bacterium 4484_255]